MDDRIGVVTRSIANEAGRLGSMGGELEGSVGWLAASGEAAADTPAAGEFAQMTQDWIRVLGQYAAATDDLAGAVEAAAWCYAVADQTAMPAAQGG